MTLVEESNTKDFKKRRPAGKGYDIDPNVRMVTDFKAGKIRWFDLNGFLVGEFGILDETVFGLVSLDDDGINRFFIGKDDDNFGYKMTKPNVDVFTAADSDVLLSDDVTYYENQYTSSITGTSFSGAQQTGLVAYLDDVMAGSINQVVRINVYKQDDIFLTEIRVELKLYDLNKGSSVVRLSGATMFLNPAFTNVVGASTVVYRRYSTGTGINLLTSFSATKDADEREIKLTPTQLAKMVNGWNEFLVQLDSPVDNTVDRGGFVVMNVIVKGYRKFV